MWNSPSDAELRNVPPLYSHAQTPWQDKMIYEHLFLGGCDWYLAEYSPQERIFFGFAILNNDLDNAEWGYVSFDELRAVRVRGLEVDRDLHWTPRKASQIERIVAAYRGSDSTGKE